MFYHQKGKGFRVKFQITAKVTNILVRYVYSFIVVLWKAIHVSVFSSIFQPHWLSSEVSARNLLPETPPLHHRQPALRPRANSNRSSPSNRPCTLFPPENSLDNHVENSSSSVDIDDSALITPLPHVYATRAQSEFIHLRTPSDTGLTERKFSSQRDCPCKPPDWLWFGIVDESPGSNAVYVFDPGSETARNTWLRELMDILEMQAEIQLALQNPRRFYYATTARKQVKTFSSSDMTTLLVGFRDKKTSLSAFSSTTKLVEDSTPDGEYINLRSYKLNNELCTMCLFSFLLWRKRGRPDSFSRNISTTGGWDW